MNEVFSNLQTLRKRLTKMLSVDFIMNNSLLIAFVVLLCLLVVENRYACDKQLAQIVKLKKELEDAKYEALTVNAELSQHSRQSNVKRLISDQSIDIAESTLPPFIIRK